VKNQTKFIWQCWKCRKRNIEWWRYQFDMSRQHTAKVHCEGCGSAYRIRFWFTLETIEAAEGGEA
jgi:hypothetical protein